MCSVLQRILQQNSEFLLFIDMKISKNVATALKNRLNPYRCFASIFSSPEALFPPTFLCLKKILININLCHQTRVTLWNFEGRDDAAREDSVKIVRVLSPGSSNLTFMHVVRNVHIYFHKRTHPHTPKIYKTRDCAERAASPQEVSLVRSWHHG